MAKSKENIDSEGNVYCASCKKYLGNVSDEKGDGNIFALYATKRCPECQAYFTKEQKRAWAQKKREADRQKKAAMKSEVEALNERLALLEEENSLLRQRVAQLKDVQFQERISELEKRLSDHEEKFFVIEGACNKILEIMRKANLIK